MKNPVQGPATQSIDFGFAVKKRLCNAVDDAFGLKYTDAGSLSGFLQSCYEFRRPFFVLVDVALFGFALRAK